jgi:hypothetical protein
VVAATLVALSFAELFLRFGVGSVLALATIAFAACTRPTGSGSAFWSVPAKRRWAGIVIGALVAWSTAGLLRPAPPAQIVRASSLRTLHGAPIWGDDTSRQNRACVDAHPERARVLMFGSSVFFGVGLALEDTLGPLLEARLTELAPSPGFCVLNFAQPGFGFGQKQALARDEIDRYRPALVLWEELEEWTREYRLIGDAAFDVFGRAMDDAGVPFLTGVPAPINDALFTHLWSYQYATLRFGALAPRSDGPPIAARFVAEELSRVIGFAAEHGSSVGVVVTPALDRSFAETVADPPPWLPGFVAALEERHVRVMLVQEALRDEDVAALRLDSACHFNAEGEHAQAPALAAFAATILAE